MTAIILDGKTLAARWLDDIAVQVRACVPVGTALGVPLHMAALEAGDDAAISAFVRLKQKAAQSVGITFSTYRFDTADQEGMRRTLNFLAADDEVRGVLVELPLPAGWDTDAILSLIPSEKDVDCIAPESERAYADNHALVLPPAVVALRYALSAAEIHVLGTRAVVVGQGRLVGRPIAQWLRRAGATVDVIDIDTPEPTSIAARADLLVSGVGKPGLITADWIKEGATVIDFGYANNKGDVALEAAVKKAGVLSPVPGGMGPLVVAAVLENLVTLATKA